LHAAQAVDLRKDFTLEEQTRALRDAYREIVPFVDTDRIFTLDIERGAFFLGNRAVSETVPGEDSDNVRTRGTFSAVRQTEQGINNWMIAFWSLAAVVVGTGLVMLFRFRSQSLSHK
jgi:hypothetical protein